MKSAYRHAAELGLSCQFHGKWVWTINTLPRIQAFLWKCCHDSIGVKDCLVARGMDIDLVCPLCHNDVETISHVLRDCPISMQTWNEIGVPYCTNTFFSQSLHTWLAENCTVERGNARCLVPWKVLFPFAVWLIWYNRNQVVFSRKNANPNLAKDIIQRAREFFFCAYFPKVAATRIVKQIRWERPTRG